MSKKLTTEEFIDRARKVHGDRYDYSKVEYINCETKVCIICKEHGEFYQTPHTHLQGQGCPKCSKNRAIKKTRKTTEQFINELKSLFSDKYDYSKVNYTNSKTKVCIICKEHGEFLSTPNQLLLNHGCPRCVGRNQTLREFIEKAIQIHGNKYNYSTVEYINTKTVISIICPEHGEFYQTPHAHLAGNGCPICKESHLERDIRCLLKEKQIRFISQHTFEWLKNENQLYLDFYIPDYNIAIECQGLQHFKPVEHFGGEKRFKQTQARDRIKFDLCKEHGIKILYYTNLNYDLFLEENVIHNADEILTKITK